LVGSSLPLTQLVGDCGHEIRLDLSNDIEKILNYKLLLDYSNLSEIEKSYFVYTYILYNPREFEGLSNILVTYSLFYELDTKLKGVVTPNDFLENITE